MTASNLMLAILAMDSYNRGYGAGIEGLGGIGSKIGGATISTDSTLKLGEGVDSAAGFYAVAYDWNGQKIISYRGTDFIAETNGVGGDVVNGYGRGAGVLAPGGFRAQKAA